MSLRHGQGIQFHHLPSILILITEYRCLLELDLLSSDEHGDRPRPLPLIGELKGAIDVTERKGSPSWDYDVSTLLSSINLPFSISFCVKWLIFYLVWRRQRVAGCGRSLHQSVRNNILQKKTEWGKTYADHSLCPWGIDFSKVGLINFFVDGVVRA